MAEIFTRGISRQDHSLRKISDLKHQSEWEINFEEDPLKTKIVSGFLLYFSDTLSHFVGIPTSILEYTNSLVFLWIWLIEDFALIKNDYVYLFECLTFIL